MKKLTKTKSVLVLAALSVSSLAGSAQIVQAQTAPNPRFSVDLKDATLRDALELVFQAAGNPSHVIDPAASQVRIGSVSFKDQEWRDIVRNLANLNKFSFRRENGLWIVAPRTTRTANSTDVAPSFRPLIQRNALMQPVALKTSPSFAVDTRTSAQFGTGTTGTSSSTSGTSGTSLTRPGATDSDSPWIIIEPLHIYAGSIALFFQGGTVISTAELLIPSSGAGLRSGNSNNNNGTNNNGTGTGTGTGLGSGSGFGTGFGSGSTGTGGIIISR